MKGIKIFLVVFAVFILLLAGLFITIKSIDFNQYKGLIAQQVKDATGRELTMVGDLDLGISLTPDLIVNDARFANTSWGTRPEMITVDRLEIEVALIPLLSGDIQIVRFNLIEPHILLETNADGRPNWHFDLAPKEPSKAPIEQHDADAATLDLDAVSIEKAHLAYRDGRSGKTSIYEIEHLVVQEEDLDTDTIELEAAFDGNPVSIKGTIGTVFNLLQNKPYPIDLNINAIKAELWVKGHLERPLEAKGANLAVAAKIPNLSNLSQFTAAEIPDVGPLEFNAKLRDENEIHHIDELEARLGNIQLSGNGQVVIAGEQPSITDFSLALKVPDFSSVSKLIGTELPSVDPIKVSSKISYKDNTVKFSTLTATMGEVNVSGQGTLDLAGDTPRVSGLTVALNAANLSNFTALAGTDLPSIGPLKINAKVAESKGAYKITKINAKLGNSELSGEVSVATKGKRPMITANLTSTTLDITALTPQENAKNKKTKGKTQQKTKQKQQMFSPEPLPLEILKFANADVKIKAKKVVIKPRTYKDVDVALKLKDGKLDISRVKAKFAGGSLALDGSIDAATPTAHIGMNVSAKRLQMGQLNAFKDLNKGSKIDMSMKVSGAGKSIQQIMAGLNGNVLVQADKGQLLYENADLLGEDLLMRLDTQQSTLLLKN